MKKVLKFLVCLVAILPMMFFLSACDGGTHNYHTFELEFKVLSNIADYVKDLEVWNNGSSQDEDADGNVIYHITYTFCEDDTTTVKVLFDDSYKPQNPAMTLDGNSFEDFAVKTSSDNEFETYIEFSLPSAEDVSYTMTLSADGVSRISKSYAIDLQLPKDAQQNVITTDFAGANYLQEISIKAFKGDEQVADYYTLEEIAQLNADTKVQFKAYMEMNEINYKNYFPIFYVKSGSQYVNDYNETLGEDNSIISQIFKIGNNALKLNAKYYPEISPATDILKQITAGNLRLSLDNKTAINGQNTLTIDPSAVVNEFTKAYNIKIAEHSSEFEDIRFRLSRDVFNYGSSEFDLLISIDSDNYQLYGKENIELNFAKVYMNGVEIPDENVSLWNAGGMNGYGLLVRINKTDTADKFYGEKATLVSTPKNPVDLRDMNFDVKNLQLKNIGDGKHLFVVTLPYAREFSKPLAERMFYSENSKKLVGHVVDGDSIRFSFIMSGNYVLNTANKFRFDVKEFGFKAFKIRMSIIVNGYTVSYTTDEINLLTNEWQKLNYTRDDGNVSACNFDLVYDYTGEVVVYMGGMNYEETYATHQIEWGLVSGYKFEFIDTTPTEDNIQLEFNFDKQVESFKINGEDADVNDNLALEQGSTYEIRGTSVPEGIDIQPHEYNINFTLYDKDGNVLQDVLNQSSVYGSGHFVDVTGSYCSGRFYNDGTKNIEFYLDFSFNTRCRIGTRADEQGRAIFVEVAKVVFTIQDFIP